TGTFSVNYDSTSGEKSAGSVQLTNTGGFKRHPFYITDGRFANALSGQNDFRIVSPTNDLIVRDVLVTRSAGTDQSSPIPTGFNRSQKIVGTYYFPSFDGYRPTLWPASTIGPPGESASTHVDGSYSARSIATQTSE